MVRECRKPAHRARHGESRVAKVLRRRVGRNRERLRASRELPNAPRTARLARGGVSREWVELQEAPQVDCDERDLQAVLRGAKRPHRKRSSQLASGTSKSV